MRKVFATVLVALAAALGAERAAAQGTLPITLQVRLDAGIPTGDFGDTHEVGVGWGVDAAFDLTPTFSIYGGYSRFEFDVDDTDISSKDDGFDLGGRVLLGTGGAVWTPYAQFGALFHDDETGFEVGLGAEYPVGPAISLTPLVRYRNIDDLEYVTVGVGLSLRP